MLGLGDGQPLSRLVADRRSARTIEMKPISCILCTRGLEVIFMQVKLAAHAGYCKGVRLAINKALDVADRNSGPIYTLGPLIHNPQTVEALKSKNIISIKAPNDVGSGTVVIRSHGIPPETRRKLKESKGIHICDATCPDVGYIQAIIRRFIRKGYSIIIVGERDHAEVVGLNGYAEGRGHVIATPEEVSGLPPMEKVAVVVQSTQYTGDFKKVCDAILARFPKAEIVDTICNDTKARQEEIEELCREVEAMVVVGGRNSANTSRLAEISSATGVPTFHVETEEEIDLKKFKNFLLL